MTNRLVLMRHAKSEHDDPAKPDHDRALTDRGRDDTATMAQWLDRHNQIPDLILCSSSYRTRETADWLLSHWNQKPIVDSCEELYLSSPGTMLDVLVNHHREIRNVMILTHNPGISTLASMLAKQSLNMVTAAIAAYDVDDFNSLVNPNISIHAPLSHLISHLSKHKGCTLTHFVSPKTI